MGGWLAQERPDSGRVSGLTLYTYFRNSLSLISSVSQGPQVSHGHDLD